MASEIIVNTIKAPTSGANANTIVIPAGHKVVGTDEASIYSVGQIIQTVQYQDIPSVHRNTSSTSYVATGITLAITPKFNNSRLIISYMANMSHPQTNMWGRQTMYYKIGTGSYSALFGGTYDTGYQETLLNNYAPSIHQSYLDVTSTDTHTFQPYASCGGGSAAYYYTHIGSCVFFQIQEIKQ